MRLRGFALAGRQSRQSRLDQQVGHVTLGGGTVERGEKLHVRCPAALAASSIARLISAVNLWVGLPFRNGRICATVAAMFCLLLSI